LLVVIAYSIVSVMIDSILDYRKAYEAARRELAELIVAQEQGQRRIVVLRRSMERLSDLCEDQGVGVGPSAEASYLLKHSSLPDEVRMLLQASYPLFERPNTIMEEVKQLGRDLSKYDNPQAAIQTILQRMAASGEAEEVTNNEGKKAYRIAPLSVKAAAVAEALGFAPGEKMSVSSLLENKPKRKAASMHGVKKRRR